MDPLIKGVIAVILGYLLGSFLPAYFFARSRKFDIRAVGSGNPGATNVADTIGYPVAVIVAIYDLGKAPIAIFIAGLLGNTWLISYLAGFAALAGHIAPFYLRFRGGEGIATATGTGFYTLGVLLTIDGQFAYVLLPILAVLGLVYYVYFEKRPAETMIFLLLPILLNATILFFGINIHSMVLLIVCLYIIGRRIAKLLLEYMPSMLSDERKMLWRKWLRPLAFVFPLGAFFSRQYTLAVLLAVFICFVIFEAIRFKMKHRRFPLPYRRTEESRISSIVIFLFAILLVLWFFPVEIASLAILFVVFGDLLAWCIGVTVGGRGFLSKTWSGTTACFITCATLAILYYSFGLVALPVGIAGAVTASAIEVAPLHEDNFVMPVASAIVMAVL